MKFITIFLLFFPILHLGELLPRVPYSSKNLVSVPQQDDTRQKAFNILRTKCNICHATKKRTNVFTMENMGGFATEINEQVFVKKKMPRGRKVQLTENESQILGQWIEIVLETRKAKGN